MDSGKVPTLMRLNEQSGSFDGPDRDLRGYRVFDRAGVEIGVVDDMLVDASERRVRLLRIAPRDPLDIDPPPVLVPVEVVDRLETDRLFLDQMRERVLSGPPDDPATTAPSDRWSGLYRYYDLTPYWTDIDEAAADR